MTQFANDIRRFNHMYRLASNDRPTLEIGTPVLDRLKSFKSILSEELQEIDEIIAAVEQGKPELETLTMLADLLGDLQVYCASEMRKFGLPLDEVLGIIMQSNFSKLGEDGQPIYDERGKVQKGPGYWKPEPRIAELLKSLKDPGTEPNNIDPTSTPRRFRHYKGGEYTLVSYATMEVDQTPMVVYRSANGQAWVRTQANFEEDVVVNGTSQPRFSPL